MATKTYIIKAHKNVLDILNSKDKYKNTMEMLSAAYKEAIRLKKNKERKNKLIKLGIEEIENIKECTSNSLVFETRDV